MSRTDFIISSEPKGNIMISKNVRAILLGTAASCLLPATAFAAGTTAGTSINNTATVNYTVGGAAAAPVSSNTATFLVDRKVNLTVAEVGGTPTAVTFGAAAQVTTFTVTNTSNATQDFRLIAAQQATLAVTAFGNIDNYDAANVRVFADANANGTYEAGVDTVAYIDELAADTSRTVFIVVDVPATGPVAAIAGVSLTAVAAAGGGAAALGVDLTATAGAESPTTVDVVFADDAGILDGLRDGRSTALDQYNVAGAAVTLVKTARIVSDPYNLLVNPKAVPGAVVEYCLRVTNAGPGAAADIVLGDTIPANTTYLPGSIFVGGTLLAGACVLDGTPEDDNATGIDETDLNGGSSDGASVTATLPLVLPTTTATARFRVVLN